jgi:hypothetical protein
MVTWWPRCSGLHPIAVDRSVCGWTTDPSSSRTSWTSGLTAWCRAQLPAVRQANGRRLCGINQGQVPVRAPERDRLLGGGGAPLKRDAWRKGYNEVGPHSAIGNQTKVACAFASGQACLT